MCLEQAFILLKYFTNMEIPYRIFSRFSENHLFLHSVCRKTFFIKKNGRLLGYTVGAFLAQRQPFCHFVTFPLIGESPMCPPELRFRTSCPGRTRGCAPTIISNVVLNKSRLDFFYSQNSAPKIRNAVKVLFFILYRTQTRRPCNRRQPMCLFRFCLRGFSLRH